MKLSIQHLHKQYGKQLAVNDVSFEVEPGEIVGFLGPNGAGKSTTMKIICCFIPPTSGTVELGDLNIFDHPLEIRQRIGYLPEHNPLYPDMYVHEFLDFVGKMFHIPKKERKERIEEVIELTGLQIEQHKKIGMLSKGYKQRVGLAHALFHRPDLLILDEPTSGLDPNQLEGVRELIQEIGREKTVIFSSHILSEVEKIADRVVIINRGEIVADEQVSQLSNLMGNGQRFRLEVAKKGLRLETVMGIERVEVLNEREFMIFAEEDMPVQAAIFDACVQQNKPILAFEPLHWQLEEAFKTATSS